jgi:carbamoyl-phosphate synthase large subunit
MKVMVSGAGALLGQGILRSLKNSTNKYHMLAVDPNPLSAGLYWQDDRFLLPMAKDKTFIPELIKLLQHTQPDVFILGTDTELSILARYKTEIEQKTQTKILVSSETVVEIADNKLVTAEFFEQSEFSFPMTADQNDSQKVQAIVQECGFPLIVKPTRGARSIGVVVVNSQAQLETELAQCSGCIVQEYLSDASGEFTAGAVVFDGKCDAAIVMKRDLRDGNTYRATVVQDQALEQMVRQWSEKLNPLGPANFQFRINRNNEPTVFEINGRFSGTTPLRALVGFNEVEMVLHKMVYGTAVVQPVVQNKTILRHWSETVVDAKDISGVQYVS